MCSKASSLHTPQLNQYSKCICKCDKTPLEELNSQRQQSRLGPYIAKQLKCVVKSLENSEVTKYKKVAWRCCSRNHRNPKHPISQIILNVWGWFLNTEEKIMLPLATRSQVLKIPTLALENNEGSDLLPAAALPLFLRSPYKNASLCKPLVKSQFLTYTSIWMGVRHRNANKFNRKLWYGARFIPMYASNMH